ncbi:HEAT repeat domain-containing protein [Candidatus Poribacteria bacterium]|nr:HEAT repeat domain-containing protein [Candidatus Poribacteria bacterium]
MANRRSFKSDESFLEKISIGAVGTHRVFEDLKKQGHNPIELERGSMSFKIWKTIKIKRIRVPDLLCVSCGRRIESRAKTALEISMSHSFSDPDRSWDFGLDDDDLVAFVACQKVGERPIDWQAVELIQYISVGALRDAQNSERAILVKPKGAEEGFEVRINWPAVIAHAPGIVTEVTPDRVKYKRQADNRTISLNLCRKGLNLLPLVNVGESIMENQLVGAVVPVSRFFACRQTVSEMYYLGLLTTLALSKRYAAAKALCHFTSGNVTHALTNTLTNADEHIYVRLEAAASLVRQQNEAGIEFIKSCLADDYLQNRFEAVIVLGEIATDTANRVLIDTLLDETQHSEIRAGAAWALGELRNKLAIGALIDSFMAVDNEIRIEAARALAKLSLRFTPEIIKQFPESPPDKRHGIAWALSKSGQFALQDMIDALVDDDARQWVAYMLGTQNQKRFLNEIELLKAKDPEVYFAVTVLWKIMTSWVYSLEEY